MRHIVNPLTPAAARERQGTEEGEIEGELGGREQARARERRRGGGPT